MNINANDSTGVERFTVRSCYKWWHNEREREEKVKRAKIQHTIDKSNNNNVLFQRPKQQAYFHFVKSLLFESDKVFTGYEFLNKLALFVFCKYRDSLK